MLHSTGSTDEEEMTGHEIHTYMTVHQELTWAYPQDPGSIPLLFALKRIIVR